MDLIKGANGKTSKTKVLGWAFTIWNILAPVFHIPAEVIAGISAVLVGLGAGAVKDAIDKTAAPGSLAAAPPPT